MTEEMFYEKLYAKYLQNFQFDNVKSIVSLKSNLNAIIFIM